MPDGSIVRGALQGTMFAGRTRMVAEQAGKPLPQ
jgi:hypothetical protein